MFSNSWCPWIINAHQSPQYLEKKYNTLVQMTEPFLIIPNNFENILKIYISKTLLIRQILKNKHAISIKWFKINWTPKKKITSQISCICIILGVNICLSFHYQYVILMPYIYIDSKPPLKIKLILEKRAVFLFLHSFWVMPCLVYWISNTVYF